jgi:single-strand DNA-binding protein
MASINKVIILGNLTRDPEVRYTPEGKVVTKIGVATGRKDTDTEYHSIVLFDKIAETAGKYLKKGRQVYIEGRMSYQKYTDKNGVDKISAEIIANDMQLLGPKPEEAKETPVQRVPKIEVPPRGKVLKSDPLDDYEDDIPF